MTAPQPPPGGEKEGQPLADPEGLGRKFRPWQDALSSDADMTTAVKQLVLKDCCWAGSSLGWRRYDGGNGTWAAAAEEQVTEDIRHWMLGMRAYCMQAAAAELGKGKGGDYWAGLADGWRKAATAPKMTAVTRLARGACYVSPSEFDTHPDLLNCPNGIVDLRTGTLLDHSPALRFTQVTGADYTPGAEHEDITKALEAIPADVRGYAQLRYGQAITGYKPPDDVIDVQHGQGENGKTTIMAAIRNALGDYAEMLPVRLLYLTRARTRPS
jgi:hypothetical protein